MDCFKWYFLDHVQIKKPTFHQWSQNQFFKYAAGGELSECFTGIPFLKILMAAYYSNHNNVSQFYKLDITINRDSIASIPGKRDFSRYTNFSRPVQSIFSAFHRTSQNLKSLKGQIVHSRRWIVQISGPHWPTNLKICKSMAPSPV